MDEAQSRSVAVPVEVYSRLSELLAASGADSVDELVARILRDWVSRQMSQAPKTRPSMPVEDEKIVEDRLKSLGYF